MFEIYRDETGFLRWRLRLAAGGRIIATSAESFGKRSQALSDIKRVQALAPGAQTVEVL